jgi:rhamnulokinase
LGLPTDIYTRVIQPGTKVGQLLPGIQRECGLGAASVVAPVCHDTGSAVAAVPAQAGNWAFLSSGTWSLLGREMPGPFINEKVLARNFTNEGGAWGTTRLLKNICGMWLLEECRREWASSGSETSYAEILAAAEAAEPFRSLIDVDEAAFVLPGGMPGRIADACRRWKQPVPENQGQFARCIFESLALKYRLVLDDLQTITAEAVDVLHIVGGGSRNKLLCQFAADASGIAVSAGPVEATALGNILLQAMAEGQVGGPSEAREIVRRSVGVRRFEPRGDGGWEEAAGRLREIILAR